MVGSNFSQEEEELLIVRMLERRYDFARLQEKKSGIVKALREELRAQCGRRHTAISIIKHWSDLKRRHMDRILEIRGTMCPDAPQPRYNHRAPPAEQPQQQHPEVVMPQTTIKKEEDHPGPSHHSGAPPPEVVEMLPITKSEDGGQEAGPSECHNLPLPAAAEQDGEEGADRSTWQDVLTDLRRKVVELQRKHAAEIAELQEELQELRNMQKMQERRLT